MKGKLSSPLPNEALINWTIHRNSACTQRDVQTERRQTLALSERDDGDATDAAMTPTIESVLPYAIHSKFRYPLHLLTCSDFSYTHTIDKKYPDRHEKCSTEQGKRAMYQHLVAPTTGK